MVNLKQEVIFYLKDEVKKNLNFIKILIIGSNGVNSDVFITQRDIDFIIVIDDSINCYEVLKKIAILTKNMILKFDLQISIYPIKESVFKYGRSMFLENIRNKNEVLYE